MHPSAVDSITSAPGLTPLTVVTTPEPDSKPETPLPNPVPPSALQSYSLKWRGIKGKQAPPRSPCTEVFWAFVGSFTGIGVLALLHYLSVRHAGVADAQSLVMLIGSFGATAVLVYGVPSAPLAQPRNVMGGHVLSAFVGVALHELLVRLPGGLEEVWWLAAALAVSLSLCLMMAAGVTHPPGSATALIAVMAPDPGWFFILVPTATGAAIMVLVALLVNNCAAARSYPQYW